MVTPPRAGGDIAWRNAARIIRSAHPPIDLFEDIADPADWPLLISAEQKTNPRLMEAVGNLAMVPPERRVSGPGASFLMAPFTHASTDRPSRFGNGSYGVLYAAREFETALLETMHHHARFMAATREAPGWTSQFREILLDVEGRFTALDAARASHRRFLDPDSYAASQELGARRRRHGANGIAYPSVRRPGGRCAALFYPDLAANAHQGRHLDYHWDGGRVDLYREADSGAVFRIA